MAPPAALVDLDGTLVDTNYHHALAWYRAFRQLGVVLPTWRIHRHVGMGGVFVDRGDHRRVSGAGAARGRRALRLRVDPGAHRGLDSTPLAAQ